MGVYCIGGLALVGKWEGMGGCGLGGVRGWKVLKGRGDMAVRVMGWRRGAGGWGVRVWLVVKYQSGRNLGWLFTL